VIRVKFKRPADAQWLDWVRRGRAATKAMIRSSAAKPAELIDEDLYKEERLRFLDAFHQKCAYCEIKIVPGQRAGDVEHFRPKGRVMTRDGKPVFSKEEPHPGYYWLAYYWQNLLPACLACNRPGTDPKGFASGKWDRFPVASGTWARSVREVLREKPLLLNPWRDDPNEHLVFDDPNGMIGYKTSRGEATIEILGLNRDGLPEARRLAFRRARLAFRRYHESLVQDDENEVDCAYAELLAYETGSAEFAAVGRAAIAPARERYEQYLKRTRGG
jgi:hypothetical protein